MKSRMHALASQKPLQHPLPVHIAAGAYLLVPLRQTQGSPPSIRQLSLSSLPPNPCFFPLSTRAQLHEEGNGRFWSHSSLGLRPGALSFSCPT